MGDLQHRSAVVAALDAGGKTKRPLACKPGSCISALRCASRLGLMVAVQQGRTLLLSLVPSPSRQGPQIDLQKQTFKQGANNNLFPKQQQQPITGQPV